MEYSSHSDDADRVNRNREHEGDTGNTTVNEDGMTFE
jgi:hypothetical protein